VLTSCDDSSLVVDSLRNQARGQNTTVTCFYPDFAARKELSATDILGSLLKQIISGMKTVSGEISRGLQEQRNSIHGPVPQLVNIVQMLQLITSSQPVFLCIDALDECAGVELAKVLESLKQILEKSPGTRIFVTGRPHIQAKIEEYLSGRVVSVSVVPSKDDIIPYLRTRLAEDIAPDGMDELLEADTVENTPGNVPGT